MKLNTEQNTQTIWLEKVTQQKVLLETVPVEITQAYKKKNFFGA
jgi:hypothetical protein